MKNIKYVNICDGSGSSGGGGDGTSGTGGEGASDRHLHMDPEPRKE